MLIETEIENKVEDALKELPTTNGYSFVKSRQVSSIEDMTESSEILGVITIASGIRQHDDFSMPMINVPVVITIVSRVERDNTGTTHENLIESILDKLSYWHKFPREVSIALNGNTYSVGEIRMTGGAGRSYDKNLTIWTDTISFNIRGT